MKKLLKFKTFFISIMLLLLLSPICMAVNEVSDNVNVVSTANQTDDEEIQYQFVASDLFKFDTDVTVDDIVDGNVFAFGQNITISGEIGGDVFAFGNNVTVTKEGYVHGSIFVMGNKVTIDGIAYDIYGCASNFVIDSNSIIARDVKIACSDLTINGQIKRNAYIVADNFKLADTSSTLIYGNLKYQSSSEISIPDGTVAGTVTYNKPEEKSETIFSKVLSYVRNIVSTLLYSLVITLLVVFLAPNFKEKTAKLAKNKLPLSLVIGILTIIAVFAISFALFLFTGGLGIGISGLAITLLIVALTISKTIFAIGCSKLIITKMNKDKKGMHILFTELVVLLISLIEIIPFVGGLVGFITSMMGLGIIVLNIIPKKAEKLETLN